MVIYFYQFLCKWYFFCKQIISHKLIIIANIWEKKHSHLISLQRNMVQHFQVPVSFDDMLICNFLQKASKLPRKMERKQIFLKVSFYYLYFPRLRQISFPGSKFYLFGFERQSICLACFRMCAYRMEQNKICQTLFLWLADIGQKEERNQKEILKNT